MQSLNAYPPHCDSERSDAFKGFPPPLAIGVPYEDVGNIGDAGAVNVLYGSSAGLTATAPDDQFWHQDVGDGFPPFH